MGLRLVCDNDECGAEMPVKGALRAIPTCGFCGSTMRVETDSVGQGPRVISGDLIGGDSFKGDKHVVIQQATGAVVGDGVAVSQTFVSEIGDGAKVGVSVVGDLHGNVVVENGAEVTGGVFGVNKGRVTVVYTEVSEGKRKKPHHW